MQPHGEEMIARRLAWLITGTGMGPRRQRFGILLPQRWRPEESAAILHEPAGEEDVKEKESGTEKEANPSIVDQIAFDQRKRDWSCLQAAVGKLTHWRAAMKRSASAGILRIFVCSCCGKRRPHKHGGRLQVLPW